MPLLRKVLINSGFLPIKSKVALNKTFILTKKSLRLSFYIKYLQFIFVKFIIKKAFAKTNLIYFF